ncbi:hypothetical protein [Roseobacter sp. TSBP12]|uniref:hypothetical protein n=1 Tax=Roseobacter sp. TSBP12 TaxID=1236613 RepID=UPI00125EB81B|nr:hypothetical protein [Roseobacter sp. TSBP12]KAB6714304.1 hypothetical protein C8029_21430 [Roseobacter sp. TSBP12]
MTKTKFDVSGLVHGLGETTHRITAPNEDAAMIKFSKAYPTKEIIGMRATPIHRDDCEGVDQ